jgi:hypothetical protein
MERRSDNMKQRPPVIAVRKTSSVPLDDWNGIETLFASADFAPLGQAWLDEPEPPFRGARAAAIRTDDALVVYGEMDDDDMYNDVPESEFNRIAINFGDMFEVFVQPCRQNAY